MSFLRVTNIQDLNGNNTVAITSASSGNLIVKKELLGESGANFTGVGTINNIQIGAGIITATSGVVTFFGDITPTDINVSGAMTAAGGFTGDLVGDVTGDLTGNVVGFGVSIVGVGSFGSLRVAEGGENGVTINESGILLDQLAGIVTSPTFDGNLTGNVTGDVEGNIVGQGASIVGVGTFGSVFITGIGITLNESGINVPTGVITATSFDGNFVGTIEGNVTGTASSATTLIDAGNMLGGTINNDRLPTTIIANLTGTASTATNLADAANITTGTISDARLPDLITSNINVDSGISTFSIVGISTLSVTEVITGIADTANNLADAANITTGTISDARLPTVITSNIDISTGDSTFNNVTVGGNLVATATTATNLANGANITDGTISDARLPNTITSNINATDGSSSFNEITVTTLTVSGTLTGTATTATNLADAANIITGTISDARLPAVITSNITAPSGASTFDDLTVTGTLTGTASSLANAANINAGTVDNARLPNTITSNITAPDGTSTFDSLTATNVTATNLTVSGTLTGTATTLADAGNITTGTLNVNRLPATLPVNIGIGTQTLSFSVADSTLTLTVDGIGSTSFTLTSG